jgi:hypothetical protein
MARYLQEHLSFTQARAEILSEEAADGSGKNLYLKGICIEGGVKNANERVYPVNEIASAVDTINEQIKTGHSVLMDRPHQFEMSYAHPEFYKFKNPDSYKIGYTAWESNRCKNCKAYK